MKKIILLLSIIICALSNFAQKQKVWLDADTGNEMDDLYAIVRLVKEPSIDLLGLSSAHFNNPDLLVFDKWNAYDTKGLNTVEDSQRLNEQILKALERLDIPHPLGADRQVGRAWGQQDARDSEAAQAIIAAVKTLHEGEKLDILTIGAMTNLASALILLLKSNPAYVALPWVHSMIPKPGYGIKMNSISVTTSMPLIICSTLKGLT